jgi:hypothetical protein
MSGNINGKPKADVEVGTGAGNASNPPPPNAKTMHLTDCTACVSFGLAKNPLGFWPHMQSTFCSKSSLHFKQIDFWQQPEMKALSLSPPQASQIAQEHNAICSTKKHA